MWDVVGTLGGLIALIGAIAALFFYGKKEGKTDVKADQMEQSYKNEVERDKVDRSADRMSDAESDSVRKRYSRD